MNIQREVEALRDIKRRSTTPGALAIDPDLPAQSGSSSNGYWSGDHDSSSSNEDGSSSHSHTSDSNDSTASDDPFHLFWVPASVHPEIAPAEFRAFLKEHSRSPPPSDGFLPSRSSSLSSTASSGLGRKKSMLSRQYSPSENDGVENEEQIVPLRRNRTGRFSNQGPQLTISDLQKLEELAEEASQSNDPSKFRNILRRSLSLNVSPTAMDKLDSMPEMGDEADTPIIVPPPGQILRRAARTKIRKPGLPGDGGGHRFTPTRRGGPARAGTVAAERTSSDRSSSDHGHVERTTSPSSRPRALSDDFHSTRPESFSEEASIFDAYVRDDNEDYQSSIVLTTSPPPPEPEPLPEVVSSSAHLPPHEVQPSLLEALGSVFDPTYSQQQPASIPLPVVQPSSPQEQQPPQPQPQIHQPQPERLLTPQLGPDPPSPSRTPSPSTSEGGQGSSPTPSFLSSPPGPQSSQQHRKEKDKKGLFGKWGSDKSSKKHSKDKDHTRADSGEKEKEKESGFFGSLFGGGKKNKDSESAPPVAVQSGATGRETAQALLGQSKSSKNYQPPPSPGATAINNYSRYPIHVERAIYRLSHIKLANPRRPLYEQVLISNLMFWYLGVINKAQNPTPPQNGQAGVGAGGGGQAGAAGQAVNDPGAQEKEASEKEQREAEQKEKERSEREAREKEQREREMEMKKREVSPKRGSLTKAGAGGARRAEMPVKGPQYEMQHREMQQEYGYGGGQGMPRGRGPAPPSGAAPGGIPGQRTGYQPQSTPNSIPPRLVQQSSENQGLENSYYSPDMPQQQQRLPPGAMAPLEQSNWGASPQRNPPSLGPHRRSTSPPQQGGHGGSQNDYVIVGGGRTPGRSLSATALPSPPLANGKARKGTSVHAVTPKGRPRTPEAQGTNGMGEEDMPLAVWQQQRRR